MQEVFNYDLFGNSPNKKSIRLSVFMPLYFYNMHEDINVVPPPDPDSCANISKYVAMVAYEKREEFGSSLEKFNTGSYEEFVIGLQINLLSLYKKHYQPEDRQTPYIQMYAFALMSILSVSNLGRPNKFIQKTIGLVARILNSKQFLVDTSVDSLSSFAQLRLKLYSDDLLSNARNMIKAPLPLTKQDFLDIVAQYL